MRILIDIIPQTARRYVYAGWALISLVLGAWAAFAGAAATYTLPAWYAGLTAVYAFATAALGLTAYSNTSEAPDA